MVSWSASRLKWYFSRQVWKVPRIAEPSRPPRFWLMPNITEKLTADLRGSAITPPMAASVTGAVKKALPKPSRTGLASADPAGQVVGLAVQQRGNNHQRQEVIIGHASLVGLIVRQLVTIPQTILRNGPRQMGHLLVLQPHVLQPADDPVFCSASTIRISSMMSPRRTMLPLDSQRAFSSGLARLCSKTMAGQFQHQR